MQMARPPSSPKLEQVAGSVKNWFNDLCFSLCFTNQTALWSAPLFGWHWCLLVSPFPSTYILALCAIACQVHFFNFYFGTPCYCLFISILPLAVSASLACSLTVLDDWTFHCSVETKLHYYLVFTSSSSPGCLSGMFSQCLCQGLLVYVPAAW